MKSELEKISQFIVNTFAASWCEAAGITPDFPSLMDGAMTCYKQWQDFFPTSGYVCRDVARVAASEAVWAAGWPNLAELAWQHVEDQAEFMNVWNGARIMTRHASRLAAAKIALPITGKAAVGDAQWKQAYEAINSELAPMVNKLKFWIINLEAECLGAKLEPLRR